jgi:type IX secretion system PorP/SprF family membrane protein
MKKLLILSFLFVGYCSTSLFAQQIWRRTQFAINPFLVNPAIAGTENQMPLYISYRNQWTGFKGAPTTMLASGHMQGPSNSGFGAVIQRDDTGGAISRTGVEAVGAYHFELNESDAISFGLGISANQFKIDNSKLVVVDESDIALNAMQAEASINIDANFGMIMFGSNYYFGFSTPNLLQTKLKVNGIETEENRNRRHYQFVGSYTYDINDMFDIQPSGLIKMTNSTPIQMDMNVRVGFKKMAWSSITYRPKDAVALGLGGFYQNILLGYSIDLTTSPAKVMSPFTHEVILGYVIPGKRGKYFARSSIRKKSFTKKRVIKRK